MGFYLSRIKLAFKYKLVASNAKTLYEKADKPDGREVLPGQILSNVALGILGLHALR